MDERIQYLFKKYLNNTCSKDEFEEVFAFIKMAESDEEIRTLLDLTLNEHRANIDEFEKTKIIVNNHGELEAYPTKPDSTWQPAKTIKRATILFSIAGCVIATIAFVLWNKNVATFKSHSAETISNIKQVTERSQYKHLVLPDSSEVWLNAASQLEFPAHFDKGKREVYLTGEAFFDVKHADKIPFIIYTGKVITEVLGTAFNIKAYPDLDKITISVKRGKVRVKYIDKQVAMLEVGEQVSIAMNDSIVKEKKLSELEISPWQKGKLVYDDYTIENITKDLERSFGRSIHIKNNSVSQLRVSTSFNKEMGLEKILEILSSLTDTKLSIENNIYSME